MRRYSFIITFLTTAVGLGVCWYRLEPKPSIAVPQPPVVEDPPLEIKPIAPKSPVLAGFDPVVVLESIWGTLKKDTEHKPAIPTHIPGNDTWPLLSQYSVIELEALLQPAQATETLRQIPLLSVIYEQLAISSQDRALHWAPALPLDAIKPT